MTKEATTKSMIELPRPDARGIYRFADGSCIFPSGVRDRWCALWEDRTPLKGDEHGNDIRSYFRSPEEAARALAAGGSGPGAEFLLLAEVASLHAEW